MAVARGRKVEAMPSGERVTSGRGLAILDAADRLFIKHGYRRTSMDEIAVEAGIAKGTLYIYFDSKEALFIALQARMLDEAAARCAAAEARGGKLAEILTGQLEAWFGMMFDQYGDSDHLRELQKARITVGHDVVEAAEAAYIARISIVIDAERGPRPDDWEGSELSTTQVVGALLAAARGSKFSGLEVVSHEVYHARLREIAIIFARAVEVR